MMAVASGTTQVTRPSTSNSQIYCGLTAKSPQGLIRVVTVLLKTDVVFYTINGVGMYDLSQAKFRETFMMTPQPPAN